MIRSYSAPGCRALTVATCEHPLHTSFLQGSGSTLAGSDDDEGISGSRREIAEQLRITSDPRGGSFEHHLASIDDVSIVGHAQRQIEM